LWSLERSRATIAYPLLAAGRSEGEDAVSFPGTESPVKVAQMLSNSVFAIVPRRFETTRPEGTGAFRATPGEGRLILERNRFAPRGPALLERIELTRARTIADPLRAFEAKESDVGWLGGGLHRRRSDARPLKSPELGFLVLDTGSEAKAWGAPGGAQRLVDGLDPARLGHLGLALPPRREPFAPWGGGPQTIRVSAESAYLVSIAEALAKIWSQPGHELRVEPVAAGRLSELHKNRNFALSLGTVRTDKGANALLPLYLAAHQSGRLRVAGRLAEAGTEPRRLTRTLPLAVVAPIALDGAVSQDFSGFETWDFGWVHRTLTAPTSE
jgi:peptide/nickel transport system substrate-binding protein